MIGLTLAWVGAWRMIFGRMSGLDSLGDNATWVSGVAVYVFCYAVCGALLRRRLFSAAGIELNWLFGAVLMGGGGIIPFLVGALFFLDSNWRLEEYGFWLIGNPFAWENKSFRPLYAAVGIGWAAIIVLLCRHWFFERVRSFRPLNNDKAPGA